MKNLISITFALLGITGTFFLSSCHTLCKASKKAATADDQLNADAVKLQHKMEHVNPHISY